MKNLLKTLEDKFGIDFHYKIETENGAKKIIKGKKLLLKTSLSLLAKTTPNSSESKLDQIIREINEYLQNTQQVEYVIKTNEMPKRVSILKRISDDEFCEIAFVPIGKHQIKKYETEENRRIYEEMSNERCYKFSDLWSVLGRYII